MSSTMRCIVLVSFLATSAASEDHLVLLQNNANQLEELAQGADCKTFQCPTGFQTRSNATNAVYCETNPCTPHDFNTCCGWLPSCSAPSVMDFKLGRIMRNNLGGMGPDKDATKEGIVIGNVFPDSGRDISLKILALSTYTPHRVDRNGENIRVENGKFMEINVAASTEVIVKFSFMDSETHEAARVGPFHMTFYDLDEMADGFGREYLTFYDPGFAGATLSATTIVERTDEVGQHTFSSTTHGDIRDNPTQSRTLSKSQENKAVSLFFPELHEFTVKVGASAQPAGDKARGRNVMFAGASTLNCPRIQMCKTLKCPSGYKKRENAEIIPCHGDPCSEKHDVDTCCQAVSICEASSWFSLDSADVTRNNLGRQGPNHDDPEGIMYTNVFPNLGRKVNMLLNAKSNYTKGSKGNALVKDGVGGRVNVVTGTTVDIGVTFLDADSGKETEVGPFFFSFLDFDEMADEGNGREYVTVRGHQNWERTKNSLVDVINNANTGATTFRSTVYGNGADNARDPKKLSQEQKDKSVIVEFPLTSTFDFSFSVAQVKHPADRNIVFAGVTNMACDVD